MENINESITEFAKERLRKQLELLSEASQNNDIKNDCCMLCQYSKAMSEITSSLVELMSRH